MSEKFEELRQKALAAKKEKARQEELNAKQAKDQSKTEILAELEQGYQKVGELAFQEAEMTGKMSQLRHEIDTARAESRKIMEETIPAAEKDDAFEGQEDLRAEAVRMLQEEAKTLADSILVKERELQETRQKFSEISAERKGLLGKAKGYLAEREIPESRMNQIWRYVEDERKIKSELKNYRSHASRDALYYSASIYRPSGENERMYEYEEGKTYLWGIPEKAFSDPRFHNEYVDGFREGLDKILQDGKLRQQEQLSPDQIEKIKSGKYKVKYRDKEILLYDGTKPVEHEEVPENEFLSTLTPGERKVVEESTSNYEDYKNLEKRLRLSEYREDVHEAILREAGAENEEYNRRALAEKLPGLQAELEKAELELNGYDSDAKTIQEVRTLLEQTDQLLRKIDRRKEDIDTTRRSLTKTEEEKSKLQIERDALPKTLIRGRVKDKSRHESLLQAIQQLDRYTSANREEITAYQNEISEFEKQLSSLDERLKNLEPGFMEKWKTLSFQDRDKQLLNLEVKVYEAKDKLEETKRRIADLEWVKTQWENGKYLTVSLQEMLGKIRRGV